MLIVNIRHAGLRRFVQRNDPQGIGDLAPKLRRQIAFLLSAQSARDIREATAWKPHLLTGDRKGTRSLMVSKNWRLTFRLADNEIVDLDLEDYH